MSVILQDNSKRSKSSCKTVKMDMKFCELLCVKFCHDMAGPIGAINNGIDFIESENIDMKKVAIKLVTSSSKQAISNLTFLRQAYGFISDDTEVSFYTIKTLITNFLRETQIQFDIVKRIKSEVVNGQIAKLIYNLTIMATSLMMGKGDLNIALKSDTICLTSTAPVHKVDDDFEALLTGKIYPTNLTTCNIQIAFMQILIAALGYEVDMHYDSPNLFVLTLTAV